MDPDSEVESADRPTPGVFMRVPIGEKHAKPRATGRDWEHVSDECVPILLIPVVLIGLIGQFGGVMKDEQPGTVPGPAWLLVFYGILFGGFFGLVLLVCLICWAARFVGWIKDRVFGSPHFVIRFQD
jgi:hypothetical protein